MNAPDVVVLGATGQLGLFCIPRLLAAGCRVSALLRNAPASTDTAIPGLARFGVEQWLTSSFQEQVAAQSEDCPDHPARSACLLSLGPIALAGDVLRATSDSRTTWTNAVVLGTTSTTTKLNSRNRAERQQVLDIQSGEAEIARHCNAAGIPLIFLKPTMIYGCGLDENISSLYRWAQRLGWMVIASGADGRRQPLHVDDLAKTCARAVTRPPPHALETPVCGGSTLRYREMVARVLAAADRDGRLISLPEYLLAPLAGIVGWVKGSKAINAEMVRRQARDQVFDDSRARDLLSHTARPFDPAEEDFLLPHAQSAILSALESRSGR